MKQKKKPFNYMERIWLDVSKDWPPYAQVGAARATFYAGAEAVLAHVSFAMRHPPPESDMPVAGLVFGLHEECKEYFAEQVRDMPASNETAQ